MAIPHAAAGVPIDLRTAGEPLSEARTAALVKNNEFEAIRLVLLQGNEACNSHQVDGPLTIQCLEGRVAFTAGDETRDLRAGQWLYLPGNEPHSLRAVEDSLLLLTIMFPRSSA